MIDLHTHTFMSDGVLSISELVYREKLAGYEIIAITDHADHSNYKYLIDSVNSVKNILTMEYGIKVFSGLELTYVPPKNIYDLVQRSREYGADIILVHGETPAENVPPFTNLEAIKAKVDVLAHPGHILEDEVALAKENNVRLEITSRRGHSATNGHVASLAKKIGAKLVFSNDAHTPDNILVYSKVIDILKSIGLDEVDFQNMKKNALEIFNLRG